ncbi:MAG: DUF1015 domain-containing protein [Eubacterium sp.]|nr:DUF1015 domain-containing protein [Eubacterium sp.]
MANVRPFRAIRPIPGKAAAIAALPYDVYNRQEAKEVVKNNPDSFLNIDRAETQFDDSVDTYAECVYEKAHDLLWEKIRRGDFQQETTPCYYIYELTMDGRVQTGIVACASIDDYENQVIKKHENTRADKEADRIHHVDSCNAQTGPIFLAYRANAVIRSVVAKTKETQAVYDFTSEDGIRHRVWVIAQTEDIQSVCDAFAKIGEIYIADGHHRAASAVKVGLKRRSEHPDYDGSEEFNYFLSVLFPDEELMIMDYNRVIKDLNDLSSDAFLAKVKELFIVNAVDKEARKPQKKGDFSMYLDGQWYLCTIKESDQSDDPVQGLDVSLLQNLLLTPVLGIEDPKTDKRIDFVGGIRGLDELERRCSADGDCVCAFAMYATDIRELFAVADAGLLMPPKSTWFEPKLRSGLFIHEI